MQLLDDLLARDEPEAAGFEVVLALGEDLVLGLLGRGSGVLGDLLELADDGEEDGLV